MNDRLFDATVRHALYLDGVRQWSFQQMQATLVRAAHAVRRLIADADFVTMDELGKGELLALLRDLRDQQGQHYDEYREELIANLQLFAQVDRDLSVELYEETTDEEFDPEEAGLFGAALLGTSAAALAKLWQTVSTSIVPASGETIIGMYDTLTKRALERVENTFKRGYADQWNKDELSANIIGTREFDFKDGIFNTINNNAFSVNNTAVSQTSQIATNAVSSSMFDFYQWVSVIDDVTTDVCEERDGNVYKYGEGPLPPADYNCRSDTIPVENENSGVDTPNIFDWIEGQPEEVQNDLLGRSIASDIRSGKSSAKDLGKVRFTQPLNPQEFAAKRELMLAE